MLLMLISATAVFSAMIYKWSSDAADPLLYLFLVPIIGLWAWFIVKAKRHIRERKRPSEAVVANSVQA
jgi:Co/Zn/Cd efflux system component